MRLTSVALLFVLIIAACQPAPPEQETDLKKDPLTTIMLVRHMEKDTVQQDPPLSEAGLERAEALGQLLQDADLDAIFSSDYLRTMQSAEAVKYYHPLDIQVYDPSELDHMVSNLEANYLGKTILIVGHSNTTPALLNRLTRTADYATFPEFAYGDLYIVNRNQHTAAVTRLHFGD